MQLNSDQLLALAPLADDALYRRIAAHLRKFHSIYVSPLSESSLKEIIQSGVSRARLYGMTSEYNLTLFVSLQFVISPAFDQQREIANALLDPQLPPNDRLDHALLHIKLTAWQRAGQATELEAQ